MNVDFLIAAAHTRLACIFNSASRRLLPLLLHFACFSLSLPFFFPTPPPPNTAFSFPRFSIDPQSDPEALFRIAPDAGLITTAMELDREREHWHNVTVIATQRGQSVRPSVHLSVMEQPIDPGCSFLRACWIS